MIMWAWAARRVPCDSQDQLTLCDPLCPQPLGYLQSVFPLPRDLGAGSRPARQAHPGRPVRIAHDMARTRTALLVGVVAGEQPAWAARRTHREGRMAQNQELSSC